MEQRKIKTLSSIKGMSSMLSKTMVELVIDEYEVIAIEAETGAVIHSAQTYDEEAIDTLYNQLLEIYSLRIKAINAEKPNKKTEIEPDLIEEAIARLKKNINGEE